MLALDRAGSGFGFDLADYLHTKKDILTFTDFVRRAIDQYNQERKEDWQSTGDLMEKFYQELARIEESFPDNNILKSKQTIVDIINIGITYLERENNITLNENLVKIMKNLNRATSRLGLPLREYLQTKEDIALFINLIKNAIDKYNQICQNAQQTTRERFENFYEELVKIAESFGD